MEIISSFNRTELLKSMQDSSKDYKNDGGVIEEKANITVYQAAQGDFKTSLCLRMLCENLANEFIDRNPDSYSLVIMDSKKFLQTDNIFNTLEQEHPRVLSRIMVYPTTCIQDVTTIILAIS